MRLDVFLTDSGYTKSRSRASECIKAGLVTVNGSVKTKPSFEIIGDESISLLGAPHGYVGRGGLKLEGALDHFGIDVSGMRAVDIGASTGGFTDCLLKRGASFVVAIDSGHGQLDGSLLEDPRVRSIEGSNARNLTPETVGFEVDIAVADVSFISQTLILPAAYSVLRDGGIYIGLVKPQFECGAAALGKNGIVRDKRHHRAAVEKVALGAAAVGFSLCGIAESPVYGGDGNREFLIYLARSDGGMTYEKFIKSADEVCL